MHYCDCGRISGGAQVPPVPALIKVSVQNYVQNKYKPWTNPCAERRYIVTQLWRFEIKKTSFTGYQHFAKFNPHLSGFQMTKAAP